MNRIHRFALISFTLMLVESRAMDKKASITAACENIVARTQQIDRHITNIEGYWSYDYPAIIEALKAIQSSLTRIESKYDEANKE